jgi:hypothetical protein
VGSFGLDQFSLDTLPECRVQSRQSLVDRIEPHPHGLRHLGAAQAIGIAEFEHPPRFGRHPLETFAEGRQPPPFRPTLDPLRVDSVEETAFEPHLLP